MLIEVRWAGWLTHREEMRTAYNIYVRKSEWMRQFLETVVYGQIVLIWIKETGSEGVEWMHLAQVRIQWRTLVNTVMNLWVIKEGDIFYQLSDYQLPKKDSDPWG
jgi:hypothetical protein